MRCQVTDTPCPNGTTGLEGQEHAPRGISKGPHSWHLQGISSCTCSNSSPSKKTFIRLELSKTHVWKFQWQRIRSIFWKHTVSWRCTYTVSQSEPKSYAFPQARAFLTTISRRHCVQHTVWVAASLGMFLSWWIVLRYEVLWTKRSVFESLQHHSQRNLYR